MSSGDLRQSRETNGAPQGPVERHRITASGLSRDLPDQVISEAAVSRPKDVQTAAYGRIVLDLKQILLQDAFQNADDSRLRQLIAPLQHPHRLAHNDC